MTADYLILDGGRKVRMLFNMNAVELFTRTSGRELTELGKCTDVALLRQLAHACATEGERIDGRPFEMTEIEFGGLMSIRNMTEFSAIISRQGGMQVQKKRPVPQRPWWKKVMTR